MTALMIIIVLWSIFTPVTAMLFGVTGLYRHYKGGLYLGFFRTWESDNDADRVRRVVYLSLWPLQLDDRTESEFLGAAPEVVHTERGSLLRPGPPRFKRILPPWQPKASKS